jgi:hypothetical protein
MRGQLADSADLAAWTRKYPWPTLGVAAAVGFFAAATLGSKRTQDPLAETLAAALADKGVNLSGAEHARPSMFSNLMNELIRSFAGAIEGAVAGAVSSRMQQASAPTENGHEAPASADGPAG